ncbi:hypothetical protein KR032_004755 [Drosophila birchii]|nr:hypothetical protein KR032_004755 [Drosophila birchii]
MYPNWPIPLHLTLVCLGVVVGQMFAQPLTNQLFAYRNRGPLTIESAAGQMIEEAALQQHLQQLTGSEALAPLLLQLVGQTAPNWQKQQQQQQQSQPQQQQQPKQATNQPQQQGEQHFFVYGNAASQQPQILAGFNGVNGRLETLEQQLQHRLLPKPIQAQQQYTAESRPKIVKAPPAAAVWAPALSNPPQLNQPLLRPQTTTTAAAPASCQLCCNPSEPATPTAPPCPPTNMGHEIVPLLSATALKAAVG